MQFRSEANNLIGGDGNGQSDAFVRDTIAGTTERFTVAFNGAEGNGYSASGLMSADGRYIAFSSWASNLVADDTNGLPDCFVRDRQAGSTFRVSVSSDGIESNGEITECQGISDDGRTIGLTSTADNLVSDDFGGQRDIFVHDRQKA